MDELRARLPLMYDGPAARGPVLSPAAAEAEAAAAAAAKTKAAKRRLRRQTSKLEGVAGDTFQRGPQVLISVRGAR